MIFFKALEFIKGHVIYNLAYTYQFQLKTPIGLATYFFNEFIAMSMLAKKKKRRRRNVNIHSIVFAEGISLKLSQNKKSLNEVTVAPFLVSFSQLPVAKKHQKRGSCEAIKVPLISEQL